MTLHARGIDLAYGSTTALAGVDLDVDAGEVVALVGPSGSGKTSLLYCLSGLVQPDSGAIEIAGRQVTGLDEDDAATLRRECMGFVFQFAELVPELSLRENVELPLRLLGMRRSSVNEAAQTVIVKLGIADVAHRRPEQVSGGQAQRAAVARALVHRPAIVFADEPTGALDSENGSIVLTALISLAREHNAAVILVTHDTTVASAADRRISLRDGHVLDSADS